MQHVLNGELTFCNLFWNFSNYFCGASKWTILKGLKSPVNNFCLFYMIYSDSGNNSHRPLHLLLFFPLKWMGIEMQMQQGFQWTVVLPQPAHLLTMQWRWQMPSNLCVHVAIFPAKLARHFCSSHSRCELDHCKWSFFPVIGSNLVWTREQKENHNKLEK